MNENRIRVGAFYLLRFLNIMNENRIRKGWLYIIKKWN